VDRIVLAGLEFHAHHGVFTAEGELGARFVVDVELFLPLSAADDLAATVDYSAVYALVRARVTEERFALIEALAVDLATRILAAQPLLRRVLVRVHKPHAPLPGVVRDVFAEVTRERT
jgi:dihydroneopterin aldolase